MKKFLLLLLLPLLIFLASCSNRKIENEISVILPSGTPLIAIGGLLDEENVKYDVVSGADLLTSAMISKSHDIVILPLTAGMKLYLSGATSYKLHAIITLGNSYVVSRKEDKLESIADLNSQEILAFGQNNTPDIILRKALDSASVNANISYQAGVGDVVPFFVCSSSECSPSKYILTAEPTLTSLEITYGLDLNILSLQEVLKDEISLIPQAAIFVNPESLYKDDIDVFLSKVEKNIKSLNKDADKYASSILDKDAYFTRLGLEVLQRSIPRSNIDFILAKENMEIVTTYCNLLNEYNEKILGGKVVDEEILY